MTEQNHTSRDTKNLKRIIPTLAPALLLAGCSSAEAATAYVVAHLVFCGIVITVGLRWLRQEAER